MQRFKEPNVRDEALAFIKKMREYRSKCAESIISARKLGYYNSWSFQQARSQYFWKYRKLTLRYVEDEIRNNQRIIKRSLHRGEEDGYHNLDDRMYAACEASSMILILRKIRKLLRAEIHLAGKLKDWERRIAAGPEDNELWSMSDYNRMLSRSAHVTAKLENRLAYLKKGGV